MLLGINCLFPALNLTYEILYQDYTVSTVFALNSQVKCKPGNVIIFPASTCVDSIFDIKTIFKGAICVSIGNYHHRMLSHLCCYHMSTWREFFSVVFNISLAAGELL